MSIVIALWESITMEPQTIGMLTIASTRASAIIRESSANSLALKTATPSF